MEEQKYKVGDTLKCGTGWSNADNSGGAGYKDNRVFKVGQITREDLEPGK